MNIKFCGAAEGVTGSCHLIESEGKKILLDCGQFQGGKKQDALNFEAFPFDASEIDVVVLSHAHIDHCGRLPLLVKRGFTGDIYCTDATADLLQIMLRDSAYIHEKEAEWQTKKNERRGVPATEPLYTIADAEISLKQLKPVLYDQLVEIMDGVKIVFNDAGHILGSAIVELWITEGEKTSKIVFSGDIGVENRPILRDPTKIKKADFVIMESTYGNRLHPKEEMRIESLMKIVEETFARGGTVVIPSFAVGRTQELIYEFNRIKDDPRYKDLFRGIRVYIDSPMATNATSVFKANAQVFDEEAKEYLLRGDQPLDFEGLHFTRSTNDSMALNRDRNPKIIISASGMCEAGRIRHHLRHNLWDPKCSVVFVGYQAEGTLGRRLIEGIQEVTLFGEVIKVKAHIYDLEGFSGHADRDGLLAWLGGFEEKPSQLFLVHGEADAKRDLAKSIKEKYGWDSTVVEKVSEFELETAHQISTEDAATDLIDEDAIEEIQAKIAGLHMQLEKVLYDATLNLDRKESPEEIANINNMLLELEKGTLGLSTALSEKSAFAEDKLTEEMRAAQKEEEKKAESQQGAQA